ncbi:MAG: AsmA family protein [Pseudomonadota bacterium]
MKLFKWIVIGLLALVLLAFIGVAVLLLAVDRGEYKQEIVELVNQHTGRELTIAGDLDISLFPWVGLSIGELSMSNAQGFGDAPFVKAHAANIKVEVLPLLRQELRVDRIELVDVALDLQRNAVGVNNWDDLTTSDNADATSSGGSNSAGADVQNSPIAALAIRGIEISNAQIRWRDAQQLTDALLSSFNLRVGEITLHESFPLNMDFVFRDQTSGLRAVLDLSSDVALDIQQQRYQFDGLEFRASVEGSGFPEKGAAVELNASLLIDLVEQTAAIRSLKGVAMAIPFDGGFMAEQILGTPQVMGELNVGTFVPRDLIAALGAVAPETANKDALSSASAKVMLSATPQAASLELQEVTLDSTTITGKLDARLGDAPSQSIALNIDALNLDDYLPPKSEAGESAATGNAPAEEDALIGLPVDVIKAQDITTNLNVGELVVSGVRVSKLNLPLLVRNGRIDIRDASAELYDGTADLNANVDVNRAPVFATKTHLFGVKIGPLLDDLQGDGLLSGTGDVRLDLRTQGERVSELKSALNGTMALNFRDGQIKGINVAQSLRVAKAKLSGGDADDADAPKATDFSQLSVSARAVNGVLRSDDLDVRSPLLRLTGKGDVDLTRDFVDYKARVLVTDDAVGQGGAAYADLSGLKLSVPIRGHFDDLSADITGAIIGAVKDDFDAKLDDKKDELQDALDEKKDKAAEKAKDKLDQKKEKAEEKAKKKLEDKLKKLLE